jgi:hypothetical protein
VQLHDHRVELVGALGDVRGASERAGGDDDVVGEDRVLTARGDVPVTVSPEAVDPGVEPYRDVEMLGIGLEVVRDGVLARERPTRSRERQAVDAVVLRGAVELQGVPLAAPAVADALVRVHDEERAVAELQVVCRG